MQLRLIKFILIVLIVFLAFFMTYYAFVQNKVPSNKFISKIESEKIAESKFNKITQEEDPMLKPWKQSILGNPILVRTLEEQPSYWAFPVILNEKVIGFIDVEVDGTISRYGFFYESPDNLSMCPSMLTIVTPEEAIELAKEITAKYPDSKVSDPVFVHDGAKSKTAWMIKVEKNGRIISRVFVSGKYVYERKEGEKSKEIGGLEITFEENITENEAKSVISEHNLLLPYKLKFNVSYYQPRFYTIIPEDHFENIRNNLDKNKKISLLQEISKKSNGKVIIAINDDDIPEKELIKIMNSYNLSLKRFIWVYIDYKGSGISNKNGTTLKQILEKNEKIISVYLDYYT